MTLRPLKSLALCVALAACGGEPEEPTTAATGGSSVVIDPVGNPEVHDPDHPEPIDHLAEALASADDRVDYGDHFQREEIADQPGQRLVFDGVVLETWSFDDPAQAMRFSQRFSRDGRLFDGEQLPWHETTHVWVKDRIVIMYLGNQREPQAALNAVATPVTEHVRSSATPSQTEIEELVREDAFERYQFGGQTELELVAAEPVTFADACLETEGVAEVCAQVQTPGWKLTFAHGDDRFVAHVDSGAARIFWQDHTDS